MSTNTMSTSVSESAPPPIRRDDRATVAQQAVCARIHSLESMEAQLAQMEDLLVKLLEG